LGSSCPRRSLRRIAGAALAVAASAGCSAPARLARVPVGSLLLAGCADGAGLVTFNPQTGSRWDVYAADPSPSLLRLTGDGRRAIVGGPGGSELTVVDLVRASRQRRVSLPARARALTLLDRRSTALVALEGLPRLHRVDLVSGAVEAIGPELGSASALAWSPQLERAFALVGGELVAVDRRAGGWVAGPRLALPAGALAPLRMPTRESLWIPCRDAGAIAVVSGRELALHRIDTGGSPVAVGLSLAEERVVAADASDGTLLRIDGRSREVLARIDLAPAAGGADPAPSAVVVDPSGRYAFVALVHARRIAVVDLVEDEVVGSFPAPGPPLSLAWTAIRRDELGLDLDPGD